MQNKTDFPALMAAISRAPESHGAKVALETLSMLVSAKLCIAFNGNDRQLLLSCLAKIRSRLVYPDNINFVSKVMATTWPDARLISRYRDMQRADQKTMRAMKKDGVL